MKAWTYAKYIQLVVVAVTKTDLLLERVGRNCFKSPPIVALVMVSVITVMVTAVVA